MNSRHLLRTLALLLAGGGWFLPMSARAQGLEIDLPLSVSSLRTGAMVTLRLGLAGTATDSLDVSLGEQSAPPLPPGDGFDARFIGTDIGIAMGPQRQDYRQGTLADGGVRVHEIQFQCADSDSIRIGWAFPQGVRGRLQDVILGTLRDLPMSGTGSFVETNPAVVTKFKLTVSYEPVLVQPGVLTGPPSRITASSALLSGTVNPHGEPTEYHFEYGATTAYGSSTPPANAGSADAPTEVSEQVDGLLPNSTYHFRLVASSRSGMSLGDDSTFQTLDLSAVPPEVSGRVRELTLAQNYPNPFNPSTTIRFALPHRARVTLTVFNALGGEVARLVDADMDAGRHEVRFTSRDLASGVYFYRLRAADRVLTRSLLIVR